MTTRILLSVLLLFTAANFANPQAPTKQAMIPNVYELAGGKLHISYSTTSKNGEPYLSYQDGSQNLSFKGKDIRQEKSELGTLVSVTIHMTVDSGSTTFTLLVPTVRLEGVSPVQIHTYGITTAHKFSVVPVMNLGQKESYTITELSGTARVEVF